ncbi:hypothetical protein DFJ58DRAFT_730351 [Suillus subalutaceus]|uniref:uncharacterized protein n=1 Tax=Suillus subalutaceus TaxID=48586 RepID=UPI001B880EE3|nr:uncharacterized protein DFJ58DRAFT_730351 [Suillus subalutaceus]KAG1847023.1 hypothetical protein DFJ58DRAFT_730351 [Suillus subalutaceus]
MPPKRPRQAKAGAILSGISRAGPGEADIGSMVPQDSSNHSRNHEELLQYPSTTLSNMLGMYCHLCCDGIQPGFQHQCINCSALICEQSVPRSSGCIVHGSVVCSKEEFLCPICARTGQKKDSPLPYGYSGFGRRKKVKMEWPMCLVNLNAESLEEGFLAKTTKVELINHYRSHASNLFIHTLPIAQGVRASESKNLGGGIELMHKAIKAGCPPNYFVVIDTDSDEFAKGNAVVSDVVAKSLGKEFMECMGAASSAARGDTAVNVTATGNKPWCDLTAKSRGGRRVLLLVGSHPAIRLRHHFESLVALVKNDSFDFVLGFGGSGSSTSQISHTVRSLIVETGVFGQTDPWSALRDILASNHQVLDYTTVVVLYATDTGVSRQIECRQIGKDIPASHAFGYEFKLCGTAGCDPGLKGMQVYNQREKVRLRCTLCHWRSPWVRTDEDNEHFKRVNALTAPQIFWHHFPPSKELQQFFIKLEPREPEGGDKGVKGGVAEGRRETTTSQQLEDVQMLNLDSGHSLAMDVDE